MMDSEKYEDDSDEVLGVLTGQVPVRSMPIAYTGEVEAQYRGTAIDDAEDEDECGSE